MDNKSVFDSVMWFSLEKVGEIISEVDVPGEELPKVVWLLAVDEEVVAVPTKMVSTNKVVSVTKEAGVLVCGSPVVTVLCVWWIWEMADVSSEAIEAGDVDCPLGPSGVETTEL